MIIDNFTRLLLGAVVSRVVSILNEFANDPLFVEKFALVFGVEVSSLDFREAITVLPAIDILADAELQGALGAFSAQTGKIYLTESLRAGDLESLEAVLLKEIAHYLDFVFNATDTPSDEGAMFAAIALGQSLSAEDLQILQSEDDSKTLTLGGQSLVVEQVNLTGTPGNDTLNGTSSDDSIDGLEGNDVLNGLDGNDSLWGGEGDDLLNGGVGNDTLNGGAGTNTLNGEDGDDTLINNFGNSYGGLGIDTIILDYTNMPNRNNQGIFNTTNTIRAAANGDVILLYSNFYLSEV